MELHLYTFLDASNTEASYSTQNYQDAEDYARRYRLEIIDNTFEWTDSETVVDYTGRDEGLAELEA